MDNLKNFEQFNSISEKKSLKEFSKEINNTLKIQGISKKVLISAVMSLFINGCTNKDILHVLRNDGGLNYQEAKEVLDDAKSELELIKDDAMKGFDLDDVDNIGIVEVDLNKLPKEFEADNDFEKVDRENYSYLIGYYKVPKGANKKDVCDKLNISLNDIPENDVVPTIAFQTKTSKFNP